MSKTAEVIALPSTSVETYEIAAEALYTELWNVLIEYQDMPTDWVCGVVDRVKQDWREE